MLTGPNFPAFGGHVMTPLWSTLGIKIFTGQGCQWHTSVRNNLTINTTDHTWIRSIIFGKESGETFLKIFYFGYFVLRLEVAWWPQFDPSLEWKFSPARFASDIFQSEIISPLMQLITSEFRENSGEAWSKNIFAPYLNIFLFFIA